MYLVLSHAKIIHILKFANCSLQKLLIFSFFAFPLWSHDFSSYLCRMILHIFNPEHDISLTATSCPFTPPAAARRLRSDLCFLPALWAGEGDGVLVEDVSAALRSLDRLGVPKSKVTFLTPEDVRSRGVGESWRIDPWGWDQVLCHQLVKWGIPATSLPDKGRLEAIRAVSNRRWAAWHLLPSLCMDPETFTGDALYVTGWDEGIARKIASGSWVLKEPWSSSGRGIRYVRQGDPITPHLLGWIRNVIRRQGGVMVEPYHEKVLDFGMEFTASSEGIAYDGLSLFQTVHGAYVGNLLATEEEKLNLLKSYVNRSVLSSVRQKIIEILTPLLPNIYQGPLGIDMMVVREQGKRKVVPCVEMNLRRTMGHVALALSRRILSRGVMRITYEKGQYGFSICDTQGSPDGTGLIDGHGDQVGNDR
jgi:hypothetical protein